MSEPPDKSSVALPRIAYLPPEVEAKLSTSPGTDGAVRTHPLSFVVGGLSGLRSAVLPIAAVFYSLRDEAYVVPVALAAGLAVIMFSGIVACLQWRKFTYRIGATDIRVESGIVSRAARSVPYERIQDVSLEQALLPRLFGLAEVRFETGAGGGDELKLAYLKQEQGEALRKVVRDRKDEPLSVTGDSTSAAAADEPFPSKPLFTMTPGRVFIFGMFEFSLAVMAVLAGLVQQFDFLLDFDIWEWDEWNTVLGGPGDRIAALGPVAQFAGFLIALSVLIVVGVISGVVRTISREWGFTLERNAKGFRRRRGLLTRTDVIMPVHRVQALVIATRIIRRLLGWHHLKFVSLAQDSGSSSHVVAPFARMDEIEPIARESGFTLPAEDLRWFKASAKYRVDRALIRSAFWLLGAAGLLFSPKPLLSLIPLAFIPLAVLIEWERWRTTRFAADARQLYTREFWLAPRRKIANRVKLHTAEISRGPIAQRRGYATLHLGLAGGTLAMPGLPVERAVKLREAVLESIVSTNFSNVEGSRPPFSPAG